jgi:hypothetical protein
VSPYRRMEEWHMSGSVTVGSVWRRDRWPGSNLCTRGSDLCTRGSDLCTRGPDLCDRPLSEASIRSTGSRPRACVGIRPRTKKRVRRLLASQSLQGASTEAPSQSEGEPRREHLVVSASECTRSARVWHWVERDYQINAEHEFACSQMRSAACC